MALEFDPTLTPALNPLFTLTYLVLGVLLGLVELIGIMRPARGDTVSEIFWWFRDRFPRSSAVALIGFLVWLGLHLLFGGS